MAAQLSDLSDLVKVINTVQGKGQTQTTSGGTTTKRQQTNISDQGVQELINQILRGQGGVRTVGNAARSAGMYDSTTEDMMLNDLYSRAANKAELARSPTVTTNTVPKQTVETSMPGMDMGSLAGTLATTSALSSIMKGEVPFAGAVDGVKGLFGGGGGGGTGGIGSISDAIGSVLGGGSGGGAAIPGGFMSQIGSSGLGVTGGVSNTAINAANSVAGGASAAGGSGLLSSFPGGAGGLSAGVGGLLSGFTQEEDALDSGGKLLATLGPAAAIGGPMGAAVAGLGAILGSGLSGGSMQDTIANIPVLGDVLDPIIGGVRDIGRSLGDAVGTVICTALAARGLINKRQYKEALIHMHRISPETLKGYQHWAVPIANKITAGDRFWTNFWLPIVKSRIALLRSSQSAVSHIKYPLGTMTKFVIEPVCTLIGKYLTWKERRGAQAQGAH